MLEILFMSFFLFVVKKWNLLMNFIPLMTIYGMLIIVSDGLYTYKIMMFMLSLWLILMMLMSVSLKDKLIYLYNLIIWLLLSLELSFYSNSLFWFYLNFEMSVIPVLLIILGWGYQPDRVQAGVYMLSYTVLFSLPLLIGIFMVKNYYYDNFLFMMMFIMAFMVKLPMFGVHLWLPRAHVEAPVFGSMILAGVMLKLGGYGLMILSFWLGDLFLKYNLYLIVYSLLGGVALSLICFVQTDMKLLVAYSSVVHMSLVISGIFTMKETGMMGSFYLMVGHGFCSSGLFNLLGVSYSRLHSRSMIINKGLMGVTPMISMWWFLFCSSNLSFPPSLNLVGELLVFMSILSWSQYMLLLVLMLSFFSSMYSIYLFSFSQYGSFLSYYSFKVITLQEYVLLCLHWLPLNLLILDLELFYW